ncbi:MAG: hypothetical protein WDO69_13940 [Pseudomonadota bacterium]
MFPTPLMSPARWLAFASLTLGMGSASLSACGSGDGRPGSLVSAGGESGQNAGHAGQGGGGLGDAGEANDSAGNRGDGGDDAGAAGEGSSVAAPLAIFPRQLQVDVGCGASTDPTDLVIRNGGFLPLTISSAMATSGYVVKGQLPLQIAAMASATLQVLPPAAKATASVGDMLSGHLTFVTNEMNSPTREVLLNTTLFGGQFEFTDSAGTPLSAPLPLTYLNSDICPDDVTYRVHNTGNLAFTLVGPAFPAHLGGTSTGANGQNVAPDEYIELKVGANSGTDGACNGSGNLTFTVQGSFCGSVPTLSVTWPTNIETAGCTCTAGTE